MIPPPATGNADHLQLTFDEIRVATKEFSEELGRGAFGAVFRVMTCFDMNYDDDNKPVVIDVTRLIRKITSEVVLICQMNFRENYQAVEK